eukprot:45831_1
MSSNFQSVINNGTNHFSRPTNNLVSMNTTPGFTSSNLLQLSNLSQQSNALPIYIIDNQQYIQVDGSLVPISSIKATNSSPINARQHQQQQHVQQQHIQQQQHVQQQHYNNTTIMTPFNETQQLSTTSTLTPHIPSTPPDINDDISKHLEGISVKKQNEYFNQKFCSIAQTQQTVNVIDNIERKNDCYNPNCSFCAAKSFKKHYRCNICTKWFVYNGPGTPTDHLNSKRKNHQSVYKTIKNTVDAKIKLMTADQIKYELKMKYCIQIQNTKKLTRESFKNKPPPTLTNSKETENNNILTHDIELAITQNKKIQIISPPEETSGNETNVTLQIYQMLNSQL